ncbi:hypothetical protein D0T49_09870 [Paludibacter sp. 221]|uniref:tetratricopeptide repeat protein n=1 Tax=Paludibacter sp. 221 TaxID=2302939 RepID=UPI0013D27B5B|nr:tetratricopeptide repeat protein [Paludibacter sp. 221]NDV47351.1 hypothetical protein [Paludibacter sp. 221]
MKYNFIYILIIICMPVFAQRAEDGERLFNNQEYEKAKEVYAALLKKSPKSALYNYRYARCCYELKEPEEAIKHFGLAGERYDLKNYYLGELYFDTYQFDESAAAYKKYLAKLPQNDSRIPDLQQKISQAEMCERFLARVEDIGIVDSLIVDKNDFLSYYRFGSELGKLKQERINLHPNKQEDKIIYTTQRQDRVYFSDSIGGRMNLYTSHRLFDGWSPPVYLSKILNSDADENYPFLLQDGVTMYFSSNGKNSMGGYDIFITRYVPANDSYLTPENIGMPFNSPYNDYMMVVDEINNVGWFATDRYQPQGKVAIYIFVPNDEKTIIRSDDKDYIRKAAQLKVFREADITGNKKTGTNSHAENTAENKMEFIINNNLVYTNPSQFGSSEARKQWDELNKLMAEVQSMQKELENLRIEYTITASADKQSAIAPKIIDLEKQIRIKDELITERTLSVRNEEIKFLKNN